MTQLVHHAGRNYRTCWPEQMFNAWINHTVSGDVVRVSNAETCLHCENLGLVALDAYPNTVVACPMCSIGRGHNVSWRNPITYTKQGEPVIGRMVPVDGWCWRPTDDPAQYSWNNGLGIDDVAACSSCYRQAVQPGNVCRSCKTRNEVVR